MPRVGVEDVEDPLPAGPGLLGDGEEAREHPHRRDELHEVGREGEERPEGDPAVEREPAAEGEHRDLPVRGDRLEDRRVARLEAHQPAAGREQPTGRVREVVELAVLLAEALDHADTAHGLVDDARDLAGALLRVPGRGEHGAAHAHRDDEQQRDCQQHHEREGRRQEDHHDEREHEHDEVPDDDRQEREQRLDEPEVRRRPRDELARLQLVVRAEVEALEALEDRHPQVVLHVQAHPAADPAPDVGRPERERTRDHEEQEVGPDRGRPRHDAVVDDRPLDDRRERRDGLAEHGHAERDHHVAAVGHEERPQTADPSAALRWARLGDRALGGRFGSAARRADHASPPDRAARRRARSRSMASPRATMPSIATARRSGSTRASSSSTRAPTARCAAASAFRPAGVTTSVTPRRSPSTSRRRTQPRATSPSSTPVSDGLVTAACDASSLARSARVRRGAGSGTAGASCRRAHARSGGTRPRACGRRRRPRPSRRRSRAPDGTVRIFVRCPHG